MSKLRGFLMSSALSQHHNCFWCDFPVPDCVCAVARKVANDNNIPVKRKVG